MTTSDLPAVQDMIPHRPPFLFLDEVTWYEPDEGARGLWRVDESAPFFAGHFPERPIVPGVLLVEAIAQLGAYGALLGMRQRENATPRLPVFGGVDKARFRRMVLPGEVVELSVGATRSGSRAAKGTGTAHVNGELACKAELFFVLA